MIENLKDLEKLLKICRKQGVQEIDLGTIKLKLGDLPQEPTEDNLSEDNSDPYAKFPQGTLTPEQLAFYSAGGHPDDDPYKGEQ
jgi:hypothetical protein